MGYIRIRQFDGTTPSELDYALRTLTANGAASLVFDLQDNGGGILEDAVSCIDLIAPESTVAYARIKTQQPHRHQQQRCRKLRQPAHGLPCKLGNTASAAEVVRSHPAHHERCPSGGHHHHGQGDTIQSGPQRLSDGNAVVITVAKLVCGDGSCFDGTGLTVDVERALKHRGSDELLRLHAPDRPAGWRRCQRCPATERHYHAGRRKLYRRSWTVPQLPQQRIPPLQRLREGETAASEPETAASAAGEPADLNHNTKGCCVLQQPFSEKGIDPMPELTDFFL